MNKLLHLIQGEILRLWKYKILFFGILVSFIWVVIIYFTDQATALSLAPTLVLLDAGLMSIILLSSSYFLEKQEGTIHALLVSPVPLYYVLIAKIVSAIVMAFISLFIVVGSILIFYGNVISFLPLIFYTIIVVLAHTAIGFLLILHANDFMQMLIRYMGIAVLFILPLLLISLDIIPSNLEFLALLSPSYSGQILFESTIKTIETWKIIFSILWLIIIPLLLYPVFVYKRFVKVAIEG